ncbi:MAG TPA: hypothetical protein PLG22_07140 [Kiritimatiellia bacterium]|nr:hypothetical protein [Kiritimatiellia bacterium]
MKTLLTLSILGAFSALASTTNIIVQVSLDGTQTIPPNTVATPAQVSDLGDSSELTYSAATNASAEAASFKAQADALAAKTRLYSTNYVVKSVCWVEGVGGVSFDPSNQVLRITGHAVSATTLVIRAVAKIAPLGNVIPALEWRGQLGSSGNWTNLITYSAVEISVPDGYGDYAKAYEYTIVKPGGTSAFFRIVDNSSGISGSGWYWLVYGDIIVNLNGKYYMGKNSVTTNVCDGVTNVTRLVSGLDVEFEPMGGL